MWILLWIVFGGIIGWSASLIMDSDAEQGVVTNIIIGVFGAIVGGSLTHYFGDSGDSGFNLHSFVVALVGAVFLITVVKILRIA